MRCLLEQSVAAEEFCHFFFDDFGHGADTWGALGAGARDEVEIKRRRNREVLSQSDQVIHDVGEERWAHADPKPGANGGELRFVAGRR